jgi:small-conductance mechanosensitive channel
MRFPAKKILGIVLSMGMLLISSQLVAQEQSPGDETFAGKQESSAVVPDLADITPLASKLSGRLKVLENRVTGLLDVSAFESKQAVSEANITRQVDQLLRLKDSKDYRLKKFIKLRKAIKREDESLEKINIPLSKKIRQVAAWRKEWLAEKKHWNEWQSYMLEEGTFDQLKSAFVKANDTIDTALNLVLQQLEAILAIQAKASNIQVKIYTLVAELDGLISAGRRSALIGASPPMLSSRYFSQFGSELWYAARNGLNEISWLDSQFLARNGWIVFLQGFLSLFVIIVVYRNRQVLKESKHWRLLAARPFSAALFFGAMATMGFYEYQGASVTWTLILIIVSGISLARLVEGSNEPSERIQFVYGLIIVLIVTRLFEWISLPLPLFRIYIVLTALVGLLFCLRWAGENARHKDSGLYTWLFRSVFLLMAVIIILELLGKHGLAFHLLQSSTSSIGLVVGFFFLRYVIRGGLEWLFRSSPFRRATVLFRDTNTSIRRAEVFIDLLLWGLVFLPAVLFIWKVYDTLGEATRGLLAFGFKLGSQRISVGLVITSVGVLYAAFLVSWILQKLLMDQVLARRKVELGVRHAIVKLVHYVIVFVGFLLALSVLGLDFTKLTIMLSALGVGIGFGLQGVVNNFVSGIILLFERPIRVGDMIEIGGRWAIIKRIGLRSTTVTAFDEADLIIPNANLINNEVTNWTLGNRRARLIIPVGVAYGSDVPMVIETLMACGKENSLVSETPEPQVLFLRFGESSLEFELRVWVFDIDHRLKAKSEIHQEIDRRFREAKIEIAFPQQDLHLRSVDESVILRPPVNT